MCPPNKRFVRTALRAAEQAKRCTSERRLIQV